MVFSCGRTNHPGRRTGYTADHPCIPKPHKMDTWSDFWDLRRKQGYTVAMAVEESRLLQVTIFSTLHKNTNKDRKSTRLNSSHSQISYAVFCLKKKKITTYPMKLSSPEL